MNTTIVDQCLDVIQGELGPQAGQGRSRGMVDSFVSAAGDVDMAELLAGFIGPSRSREVVSEMLGMLVWQTSDNGAGIYRTFDRWLRESSDETKCWLALNGEVLVLDSATEAGVILPLVADRFPSLSDLCRSQIDQWSRIPPRQK